MDLGGVSRWGKGMGVVWIGDGPVGGAKDYVGLCVVWIEVGPVEILQRDSGCGVAFFFRSCFKMFLLCRGG